MKILHICSYLYPALTYGGPAKVVYELSKEQSKLHQIVIFTSDVWDQKSRISKKQKLKSSKNFQVFYFSNLWNQLVYKYRFFSSFGMIFEFIKIQKSVNVIHFHDVYILPQLFIGLLAMLMNKPYVISPHGVLDPVRVKRKLVLKSIMFTFLANPILKRANCIIATSEKERRELIKLGFSKVKTVWNGISKPNLKPSNKFKYLKKSKLRLLYIGKLHPQKGLIELLEAMVSFQDQAELVIAGPDDGIKPKLKSIIAKNSLANISFIDYVDEHEKAELYSKSDVFIYPSYDEGFSISILEAMQARMPVIATKGCNFPDIKTYQAGYIVDNQNLKTNLTRTIALTIKNKDKLKKMGKHASELITSKHSISQMAFNTINIYEQFI